MANLNQSNPLFTVSNEELQKMVQATPTAFKFYDQGWNARVRGYQFNPFATHDWKDGWHDCDGVALADRVIIGVWMLFIC